MVTTKPDADIRNWANMCLTKLKKSDNYAVFKAVGSQLKEAMIAEMVMNIQVMQEESTYDKITISKFVRLYNYLRRELIPEEWH